MHSPISSSVARSLVRPLSGSEQGAGALTEYIELFADGTVHSSISITRSGDACVRDSSGSWVAVASNTARIHHNRLGDMLGLVIEGSRTNYLLDSESPVNQTVSLPSTGDYTLWMEGDGTVDVVGNTATGTGFGTAEDGVPLTFNLDSTGTVDVSVNGTVARFQLEKHKIASTYILSPSGSQGVRELELASTSDISWYDPAGTTFLVQGYGPPAGAPWVPVAFGLNDGADWNEPQNRISVRVNSNRMLVAEVIVDGAAQASLPLGGLQDNSFFSVAFRVSGDSIAASRDGNPIETASGIALPSVSQFNIGSTADTNHWYSSLRRMRVYQGALSDSELESVSDSTGDVPNPDGSETSDPPDSPASTLIQGKHRSDDYPGNKPQKRSLGASYSDPVYGVSVMRASDAGSSYERNDYSRRNPFNADNSLYLTIRSGGEWQLHDADTGEYLNDTSLDLSDGTGGGSGSREPHWHPEEPHWVAVLGANHGGLTLEAHNVITDEHKVLANFEAVNSINGDDTKNSIVDDVWSNATRVWTRWEGAPSEVTVASGPNAGWPRYWAFQAESGPWDSATYYGVFSYDLELNEVIGTYDYSEHKIGGADHVSISASGAYVIVGWSHDDDICEVAGCTNPGEWTRAYDGLTGSVQTPCGLMVFDNTFQNGRILHRTSAHADAGYGPTGNDVYVYIDFDYGWVKFYDMTRGLDSASNYPVLLFDFQWDTTMHISTKNFDKPGWALVSTYNSSYDAQNYSDATFTEWYQEKVFVIELKENPRIYNVAYTYNQFVDYWTEPQAATNRDLTRILFNSNWITDNTDAYMVTLNDYDIPAAEDGSYPVENTCER